MTKNNRNFQCKCLHIDSCKPYGDPITQKHIISRIIHIIFSFQKKNDVLSQHAQYEWFQPQTKWKWSLLLSLSLYATFLSIIMIRFLCPCSYSIFFKLDGAVCVYVVCVQRNWRGNFRIPFSSVCRHNCLHAFSANRKTSWLK